MANTKVNSNHKFFFNLVNKKKLENKRSIKLQNPKCKCVSVKKKRKRKGKIPLEMFDFLEKIQNKKGKRKEKQSEFLTAFKKNPSLK